MPSPGDHAERRLGRAVSCRAGVRARGSCLPSTGTLGTVAEPLRKGNGIIATVRPIRNTHPIELRGARVLLREVRPDDTAAAFRWGSDREYFRYLPFEPVQTMREEREFIDGVIEVAQQVPRIDYHLAVALAETMEMVGLVDLRMTSRKHRSAELGFGIRRDLWGRGLATEAAHLLVDFGFRALGLHRISAGHHPDNVASERVLHRLGMTREGHLRQNLRAHGRWRDPIVYAVLEHEWKGDSSGATPGGASLTARWSVSVSDSWQVGRVVGSRAAAVLKAMVAMLSTGDLSDLEATVHHGYLDHQGLGGMPVYGPSGFAAVVAAARRGYERLEVVVEDLFEEPDRVAARLRWQGVRPSGETVERETVEIVRIEDGRAFEHWGGRS